MPLPILPSFLRLPSRTPSAPEAAADASPARALSVDGPHAPSAAPGTEEASRLRRASPVRAPVRNGEVAASSGVGRIGAVSPRELEHLARAVHSEARGEPYQGKVAVAAVVLNRVKSPEYPNSIDGVLFQERAFSAVADGQFWGTEPDAEAYRAAREALAGADPTGGALVYYNAAKVPGDSWVWSRPVVGKIGAHTFAT